MCKQIRNISFILGYLLSIVVALPCLGEDCTPTLSLKPCKTPILQGPAPDSVCEHGSWKCQFGNVAQCNWGKWIVYECTNGTRCVESDWECVTELDYTRVYNLFNPTPTTETYSTPSPTLSPPTGSCTNGEFQCYGDHVIQCNIDHWVIWPCAVGTKCVPNDYECIPFGDWDRVFSQVNENC